jgi:hypothetical protein
MILYINYESRPLKTFEYLFLIIINISSLSILRKLLENSSIWYIEKTAGNTDISWVLSSFLMLWVWLRLVPSAILKKHLRNNS